MTQTKGKVSPPIPISQCRPQVIVINYTISVPPADTWLVAVGIKEVSLNLPDLEDCRQDGRQVQVNDVSVNVTEVGRDAKDVT